MATEIQTAQDIWPQLASIVFVPRTESDYQQLSTLLDELKTLTSESQNHPLVSLMEVVGALIEKYELEQESEEREAWYGLSMQMLARAYGEDEPEYTTDMLKWTNPDYERKCRTHILAKFTHPKKRKKSKQTQNNAKFRDKNRGTTRFTTHPFCVQSQKTGKTQIQTHFHKIRVIRANPRFRQTIDKIFIHPQQGHLYQINPICSARSLCLARLT